MAWLSWSLFSLWLMLGLLVRGCGPGAGPDFVEQVDELGGARATQAAQDRPRGAGQGRFQVGERVEAGGGDPAEHLPAVLPAALAAHQPLGLQAVEEAGHPRAPLDHPLADLQGGQARRARADRKSTRLNSSHVRISYAVFCLKKKKKHNKSIKNIIKKKTKNDNY